MINITRDYKLCIFNYQLILLIVFPNSHYYFIFVRPAEVGFDLELRLQNAELECAESQESGMFDRIIVNDNLANSTNALFRTARDW